MSIVEFPNSREDFLRLGKEALAAGEKIKALEFFQEAYQLEADFSLNFLLTNLLMEVGEHEQALSLAQDFLADYISTQEYFSQYFQLLLLNQKFLKAHEYLAQFQGKKDADWLAQLEQQLITLEDYLSHLEKQKLAELKQQLLTICSLPLNQQANLIEKLITTPLEFFKELAAEILSNSAVNYFSRLKILEELVKLQVDQKYNFVWFNQEERQVVSKNLALPEKIPALQQSKIILQEKLEQNQPDLFVALMEEIQIHLTLLYPFADEVLEKTGGVELFVDSYLLEYQANVQMNSISEKELAASNQLKQQLRTFIFQQMENM